MLFGDALAAMKMGKKMTLPGSGFSVVVKFDERSRPATLLKVAADKTAEWKPTNEAILSENWEAC